MRLNVDFEKIALIHASKHFTLESYFIADYKMI